MSFVSWDTETVRFSPGWQAPPPVCQAWAFDADPDASEIAPLVAKPDQILTCLLEHHTIVGVNIAYDMACALAWGHASKDLILRAYEEDRILDLSIQERIAEIGGYTTRKELSLAMLCRVYGVPVPEGKEDVLPNGEPVRTSYGPLLGLGLEYYHPKQIDYAKADATSGIRIFQRQRERWGGVVQISDVAFQTRKAFWLHLIRCWGLQTAPGSVEILQREIAEHLSGLRQIAADAGFLRSPKRDGKRPKNMAAIRARVTEAYEGFPPMTEEPRNRTSAKPFVPQVRTSKEVLEESGDPLLESLAEYGEWSSLEAKDLKFLTLGATEPIHTKWGIANTTRVTSAKPNVQNLRRTSAKDCLVCRKPVGAYAKRCECGSIDFHERQGIRECFVPREGNVFVAIDHGGLELCTLAQVCVSRLGRWDMASFINAHGASALHDKMGAQILGVSFEEGLERKREGDKEFKNARNCGKVPNFGCPGGMAAPTLRLYAKASYGLVLTLEECESLIQNWRTANPDGVAFLKYIRTLQRGKRFDLVIPGTTIQRNRATYCSAANCHFQGLGATIEAYVGWLIMRTFLGTPVKIVNFVHDEFIVECPIDWRTKVAEMLHFLMVEGAKKYLPDVKINAEYSAMAYWSKNADDRRINGELAIYGRDYV